MTEISREQFFGMAGLNAIEGAYTPVSIGKGGKYRDGNASWIKSLRNVNFTDSEGLRALEPETVSPKEVIVEGEVQKAYQAIVGDKTGKVYSIRSDRYKIAQSHYVSECVADASDKSGIPVFGRMDVQGGRMSINALFADPDCNVDFGAHDLVGGRYAGKASDPYMLGVRSYNSHMGDRGFGAEIIGVRGLCSNMCAFGDILGKVSWTHLVEQEKVVESMTSMILSYTDKVPILADKIQAMRNEELTLDEAECALWGIRLTPFKTEAIMSNFKELNPEIVGKNGKVSVYDVYNAATAFNSHSNTGGSEFGRTDFSRRLQDLILEPIDSLIGLGEKARDYYIESQTRMTIENTAIVGD